MILNLIQNYISQKETILNSYLNAKIQLKQIVTELDMERIGASESFINYQLYVDSTESIPQETPDYDLVNVRMDFIFLVANKNYTVYKKIFDKYLFGLRRILKKSKTPLMTYSTEDISTSLRLIDITNVSITNADRFEDDYYKPSIIFTLKICDSSGTNQIILKQGI